MSVVGADIGCKKTIICKWIKDPYNLNPDGIPFCVLNESQKDIYNTCIYFGKELTFNDSVGNRITAASKSCVSGCFQFFPDVSEDMLSLEKLFNPSDVLLKDGVVYFKLETGEGEMKDISLFVPTAFLLENMMFSALKSNDNLMNERHTFANQHSEDVDWYLIIPDYFSTREVSMLKSLLSWKHYSRFVLTKSCLTPIIEYGYNNIQTESRVCLFVDSGESHTTFTVVEYSGTTASILYCKEISAINGRKATQAMVNLLCGDCVNSIGHKTYLRCLKIAEKEKRELNLEGVDEVFVDMLDVLEDEDLEDDVCVTRDDFDEAIADMIACLREELTQAIQCVEKIGKKIDVVLPIGGNSRVALLQETLLTQVSQHNPQVTKLTFTLNTDECFVKGVTLLGHLLDKKRVFIDPSLMDTLVFPTNPHMERKITAIKKDQSEYQVALHPDCILQLPQTQAQAQSFESLRGEFMAEYGRICQVEEDMRNLNGLCETIEEHMNTVGSVLEQNEVKQTTEEFVESVKERLVKRYQLKTFPAFLLTEKQTKKGMWWRHVQEQLIAKFGDILESERVLKEVKENVYKVVYMTSRAKLAYSTVSEQYKALTVSLKDFEDKCNNLEMFVEQVVYHFYNKANLKKGRY